MPEDLMQAPFTLEDARRAGISREQLQTAAWRHLRYGLYAWAGLSVTPMLILSALHLRMPDGAAFSGRTAAWLHGLDLPPCDPVEVTIPDHCRVSGRAGMSAYLSNFGDGDVVLRRHLPTTSALRTVTDLGRRQPLVEAVAAVDMALHAPLASLADLWSFVDAHRGAKGIARLRRVLQLAEPAAASAMESRLRMLLVLAGLPRPEVQVPIYDDQGRFLGRPDLFYRQQMVAIEYDGGNHRERLVADDRRQNGLLSFGLLLLRFTAPDVLGAPGSVVGQVREALASRMSREMPTSGAATGRIVRRMSA
ncbi:MAG TPA: DUF559 domain-containing protein [Candidatus Dormibacteraeota bacterium]